MSYTIQSIILLVIFFHFTVVLYAIYRYNTDSVNAYNRFVMFAIFSVHTMSIVLSLYFSSDILNSISGAIFIILSYLLRCSEESILIDFSIVKKTVSYFITATVLFLLISKLGNNYSLLSTQALIYTLSIIVFISNIFIITVQRIKFFFRKPSLTQGLISCYYIYFFIVFAIMWTNQATILFYGNEIIEVWKLYIMVTILAVSLGLAWILSILEEIKEKAIYLSYHDSLTGLSNRRYLFEHGVKLLKDKQISAVCLFDLDKFKSINDSYGHLVGDKVLVHVSKLINNQISEKHIFSRVGGEEFCLVIRKNVEADEFNLIEALRINLENSTLAVDDKTKLNVTASFGLCIHDGSVEEIDELLLKADNCMYRAKELGRNRVEVNC